MAKNILVISCDYRETRAALVENGIIAELHIERKGRESGTVGNVYLGKVTRVLPGLQAAFIDIGQERAAFLHVEDLIRPDDFDEYLAGGRKMARGKEATVAVSEEDADEEEAAAVAEAAAVPVLEPAELVAAEAAEAVAAEHAVPAALAEEASPSSEDDHDAPTARGDDLEATVSYGSWPDAPKLAARLEPPPSAPGSNDVLVSPASAAQHAASTIRLPTSSHVILDDEDEDDDLDLDGDDEDSADIEIDAQIEIAEVSTQSLSSAPTLDELPRDGSEPPVTLAATPAEAEDDDDLNDDDLPGFTVSEPGEPVPRAPAPRTAAAERERGERGGRRRRRGRGRTDGRPEQPVAAAAVAAPAARGRDGGGGGGGGRSSGGQRGRDGGRSGSRSKDGGREGNRGMRPGAGLPGRLSKTTPIREVVREGQEIIVQVTKDPLGTKGARCSSHISLPGRYVVYLPTVDHVGISKRIGSDKERARLREAIDAMKPPTGGLIVRTVAEGLTKKGLKQDVGYLVRLWGEIAKKRDGARSPYLLSSELDLVLKVARDLFTDEVDEVVIDDKQQYERLCRFIEMFAPERLKCIKLYTDEEPIFDEYGIEEEIQRALARKVPLPSGGYLIIDQAEALTAIDVNTGRFVGKGSKDMEETILKTNLEAVNEIAYQLRFRNIGGLIILDLIDMDHPKNREKVRRTLEDLLVKDKAKTTLNRISDLGLIEMTRKRTRESLGRIMHEPCFYCDGTGQLRSKETIAFEILREVRRRRSTLPGYSVVVNAHPAVADVLNGSEKGAVADAENKYMRKIVVTPRKEYHLEQFDLVGK